MIRSCPEQIWLPEKSLLGLVAWNTLTRPHSHTCECMRTEFIIVIGPAGLTSNPQKALQLSRWASIGRFVLSQPEQHQWWIPRSVEEGRINPWIPSFLTQTTNTLTHLYKSGINYIMFRDCVKVNGWGYRWPEIVWGHIPIHLLTLLDDLYQHLFSHSLYNHMYWYTQMIQWCKRFNE